MFKNEFHPAFLIGLFVLIAGISIGLVFTGLVIDMWDDLYRDEETLYILAVIFGFAFSLTGAGAGLMLRIRWIKNAFSILLMFAIIGAGLLFAINMMDEFQYSRHDDGRWFGVAGGILFVSNIFLLFVLMLNTKTENDYFGESNLNENEQNDLLDSELFHQNNR